MEQLVLASLLRHEGVAGREDVRRDLEEYAPRTLHDGPAYKIFNNLLKDGHIREHGMVSPRPFPGGRAYMCYAVTALGISKEQTQLERLFSLASGIPDLPLSKPDLTRAALFKLPKVHILEEAELLLLVAVKKWGKPCNTLEASQVIEQSCARVIDPTNAYTIFQRLMSDGLLQIEGRRRRDAQTRRLHHYYSVTPEGFQCLKNNLQGILDFAGTAPALESLWECARPARPAQRHMGTEARRLLSRLLNGASQALPIPGSPATRSKSG